MSKASKSQRLSYIDGLRGIAALDVLLFHSTDRLRTSLGADNPWAFVGRLGTNGVELFFVLSGFCLAYPVLMSYSKGGESIDLVRYWAHRLVRIVPPYWAAIALLAGAYFIAGRHVFVYESGVHHPTLRDVFAQVFFWDYGTTWLSGTFWTLAIEMRWYIFFPLIIALWIRAPWAALLLAFVSFLLFQIVPSLPPDFFALPAFILGIAAAALVQKGVDSRVAAGAFVVSFSATLALERLIGPAAMPAPHLPVDARTSFPITFSMWQLVAFSLVLYVSSARWSQRALSSPPLLFFGAISYSLYLIHVSWILAARDTFVGLPPLVLSSIMAAFGIVGGTLFWFVFERPLTSTLKEEANARVRSIIGGVCSRVGIPTMVRIRGAKAVLPTTQDPRFALDAKA